MSVEQDDGKALGSVHGANCPENTSPCTTPVAPSHEKSHTEWWS